MCSKMLLRYFLLKGDVLPLHTNNFIKRKTRWVAGLMLMGMVAISGCRGLVRNHSVQDANVDAQLSRPAPSSPLPAVVPGEPQKGFEQQPSHSQNP